MPNNEKHIYKFLILDNGDIQPFAMTSDMWNELSNRIKIGKTPVYTSEDAYMAIGVFELAKGYVGKTFGSKNGFVINIKEKEVDLNEQ